MLRFALALTLVLNLSASAAFAATGHGPIDTLASLATAPRLDADDLAAARDALDAVIAKPPRAPAQRSNALSLATSLLPRMQRARVQPDGQATRFTVWTDPGRTARGGNPVLQADIATFAKDAERLAALARLTRTSDTAEVIRAQLDALALLARYRAYIAERWPLSAATSGAFEAARKRMARVVADDELAAAALGASWEELAALVIPDVADARVVPPVEARPRRTVERTNPFIDKVDAAVADAATRAAIRRVQPAAVKIGGGSGVNLLASGLILTNAHVAKAVGNRFVAVFPDGREVSGRATAVDHHLDLALVTLDADAQDLPTAPLARKAPTVGTAVIVVGNPGTTTPEGEPTGYKRFHVSTGAIRKLAANPLASQGLGGVGHDAWTYWGHSGSPLFNARGAIVALHNSWDSRTAMRHAVTWQAIGSFLTKHGVSVARQD